jgi:hypothetical protein
MRQPPPLDYESPKPSPRVRRINSPRVALVLLFCMPALAATLAGCLYAAVKLLEWVYFRE